VLASSTIALSSNSTNVLVAAACAGAGIAVLPHFSGALRKELVCASDDLFAGDMWLVTHAEVRRDPKVKLTVDFLRAAAPGLR